MRQLLLLLWQCRRPSYALSVLYSSLLRLRLRKCGRRLRVPWTTMVVAPGRIEIGDDFSAMGYLYLFANNGGEIIIGNNCGLNTNIQLGAADGRIQIGDDVMIGPNVVIRAANHGMDRRTPMSRQPSRGAAIVIEDDVWIGSNAVITAGVTVAHGTIVGAGAVVTRSTEAYSIVAGTPARKIGERP
jgi:galactoside O-acetyltransferase